MARSQSKRRKVLSLPTIIRELEGETDKLEDIAARLRALAFQIDRHRARALKRRKRSRR